MLTISKYFNEIFEALTSGGAAPDTIFGNIRKFYGVHSRGDVNLGRQEEANEWALKLNKANRAAAEAKSAATEAKSAAEKAITGAKDSVSGTEAAGIAAKKGAVAAGEAVGSAGKKVAELAGEHPGLVAGAAGLGLGALLMRRRKKQQDM